MARFFLIAFAFVCSFFSAISQVELDSSRIICGPKTYEQISFEEVLWIFRNKSRQIEEAKPIEIRIDKLDLHGRVQKIYTLDTIQLTRESRFANSLLAYDLNQNWKSYLSLEVQQFSSLKDSLLSLFHPKGYRVRYLQQERDLAKQLRLVAAGRSKTAISLHNFNLAADVGLYRKRRYLRRGMLYSKMGEMAKSIGMFWGGDFAGFPDPGHVQGLKNGAELVRKYPETGFEYTRFMQVYRHNLDEAEIAKKEDNFQDTKDLLKELGRLQVNKPCACQYAISIPEPIVWDAQVVANVPAGWIYLQGYFYRLGTWQFAPKK
jgi:hypothetical protein